MLEVRGSGYQGKHIGRLLITSLSRRREFAPQRQHYWHSKRHHLPFLTRAEDRSNSGVNHSSAGAASEEYQLARKGMRSRAAEQLGRPFLIGEQTDALLETNSDQKCVSRYGERLHYPTMIECINNIG